jgi:hypothetical protein
MAAIVAGGPGALSARVRPKHSRRIMECVTAESPPTQVRLTGRWPTLTELVAAVAVVTVAGIGSGLRPHTWQSTALVLATVLVIGIQAVRRQASRPTVGATTQRLRRTYVCWGVLLAAAVVWEMYAFLHQPAWNVSSADHPTLSVLLDPVLQLRPVRFVAWLLWLGAGLRLVRPVRP